MTWHFVISAVLAGTVFCPRLWQLSARRRSLAGPIHDELISSFHEFRNYETTNLHFFRETNFVYLFLCTMNVNNNIQFVDSWNHLMSRLQTSFFPFWEIKYFKLPRVSQNRISRTKKAQILDSWPFKYAFKKKLDIESSFFKNIAMYPTFKLPKNHIKFSATGLHIR